MKSEAESMLMGGRCSSLGGGGVVCVYDMMGMIMFYDFYQGFFGSTTVGRFDHDGHEPFVVGSTSSTDTMTMYIRTVAIFCKGT